MPIEHEREADWIRIVASGTYTLQEVVAAFEVATADASERRPVLVDARASAASPPYEELRETAAFAQRIAPRIGPKVALVVSGALRYGLARVFSTLTGLRSDLELRPFHELHEAEAWLRER